MSTPWPLPLTAEQARALSALTWDAREHAEMLADNIGRRTGIRPTALVADLDAFRAAHGWSPGGHGEETATAIPADWPPRVGDRVRYAGPRDPDDDTVWDDRRERDGLVVEVGPPRPGYDSPECRVYEFEANRDSAFGWHRHYNVPAEYLRVVARATYVPTEETDRG